MLLILRLGYEVSNSTLQRYAGDLACSLGRRHDSKPLSNCWLYGFLKRWGSRITSKKPSSLDSSRARHSTPEYVDSYFDNLEKTITELGFGGSPERIYMD